MKNLRGRDERGMLVLFSWGVGVHVLLRALGHAESVSLLSGTIPPGYHSLETAGLCATMYLLSWFFAVVLCPIFLCTAAILRLERHLTQ